MTQSSDHIIPESSTIIDFQFGDKRVNRRANSMIEAMTKRAQKSLPEIFCNNADLKGAYRFFSNNLVTPKKILLAHKEETIKRCKKQEVVLAIQDTSDCDFDFMECLDGFESTQSNIDKGFRIHPVLTTTEIGTPLGVLDSFNYTRKEIDKLKAHRNSLLIEEKESFRWLLGYREACNLAEQCPETTVISMADRECDIYECLMEAVEGKAKILIRAKHNRKLDSNDKTNDKIEKKLIRCPVVLEARIILNRYKNNERKANLAIRASEIIFKAPSTCKKKSLASVKINAVLVTEIDPPKGEQALHWLLLTTLPIDTLEDVRRVVTLYSQRWTIEVFFKVLKTGCRIDSRRLQETSRIENFIAFAMIVAWKTMLMTYLPREFPNAPCTLMFTEVEWKLAYTAVHKGVLPKKTPTLKEATTLVAMLGGYQKRKDPPGIQTVWRGVVRLIDMVYGYELTKTLLEAQ